MNSLWQQKIGNRENGFLHHAFLLEGEVLEVLPLLRDFLESELEITVKGNPDYLEFRHDFFGIDEGRDLKEMQSRHSFSADVQKIFVIGLNSISADAQNSLLKVFEEPTAGTQFFVVAPSARFFLPTLLSRVVCVFSDTNRPLLEISEFLQKSYKERLDFALTLKEDPVRAKNFIEDMIRHYYQKTPAEKRSTEIVKILSLLSLYRGYAYGRAPSLKNLLEHIALVAPK